MGLVRRVSGVYYYRSYRSCGRVVCQYVASGKVAEALSLLDQELRQREARQRARVKDTLAAFEARSKECERQARKASLDESEAVAATDALLVAWSGRVDAVFREAMAGAGYHQ
jgi:hypothetical protein